MAYTAWSVVFGEQPSAAKWNQLGTNDASFNDGTGIGTAVINSTSLKEAFFRARQQIITTNTAPTGLTVQYGWTFVLGSGGTGVVTKAVTFPVAFSAAPNLMLVSFLGGKDASDPTAIGDFTVNQAIIVWTNTVATTGMNILLQSRDSADTTSATRRFGLAWMAAGTV